MIKIIKALVLLCWLGLSWQASAQSFSLKTNLLYWGTLTPNLSGEIALNSRYSLDLQAAYRPWGGIKAFDMRFWLAQPELRYWFCETFEGHFMGLHLHGAQYDGAIHDRHYDGYLAGGGFTYGYQWILSPHWNLEAAIGVGYARLWYDQRPDLPCKKCSQSKHKDYLGPTKVAVSLCYFF